MIFGFKKSTIIFNDGTLSLQYHLAFKGLLLFKKPISIIFNSVCFFCHIFFNQSHCYCLRSLLTWPLRHLHFLYCALEAPTKSHYCDLVVTYSLPYHLTATDTGGQEHLKKRKPMWEHFNSIYFLVTLSFMQIKWSKFLRLKSKYTFDQINEDQIYQGKMWCFSNHNLFIFF